MRPDQRQTLLQGHPVPLNLPLPILRAWFKSAGERRGSAGSPVSERLVPEQASLVASTEQLLRTQEPQQGRSLDSPDTQQPVSSPAATAPRSVQHPVTRLFFECRLGSDKHSCGLI